MGVCVGGGVRGRRRGRTREVERFVSAENEEIQVLVFHEKERVSHTVWKLRLLHNCYFKVIYRSKHFSQH